MDGSIATLNTAWSRLSIDPADGSYTIDDRTSGTTWHSNPSERRFGIATLDADCDGQPVVLGECTVRASAGSISARFPLVPGRPEMWVKVVIRSHDEGRELEFGYETAEDAHVACLHILDRALWVTDTEGGCLLAPSRMGMVIPVDSHQCMSRTFDTSEYEGCHMQMWGIVKGEATALITWDDPYVAVEARRAPGRAGGPSGQQVLTTSVMLRKSARSIRLRFCGAGDAATLCAAYRGIAQKKGWVVPWSEKLTQAPDRGRLLGAANIKLWSCLDRRMNEASTQEERTQVNWTFDEAARVGAHLKEDLRIDRVLFTIGGWIHRGYDNQHPDILPAAPECGGDAALADCARRVMDLGYLFCLHDNYQDIYRDSPSWDESLIMRRASGELAEGGRWAGGRAYLTCSPKALELAQRPQNLPAVKALTGANAYFIDTTYAAGLQECNDPAHPLSRQDDLRWKQALSDYARGIFGVFGSECGREWAVPHADFFEGITGVGGRHYHVQGEGPDLPEEIGAIAYPLFEMVYRDCLALYGKYGYDPRHAAAYVLHHISVGRPLHHHSMPAHLYWLADDAAAHEELPLPASPDGPDPALFTRAHNGWAEQMHVVDRFIKNTYEVLSPLHALTAGTRMTSCDLLTPDGAVRRTVFGSGAGRTEVLVNGSESVWRHASPLGGTTLLPPYGFVVEGPTFAAFCALRWADTLYDRPVLFTLRSLDGAPLADAGRIRVYHGFGDECMELRGMPVAVRREDEVERT